MVRNLFLVRLKSGDFRREQAAMRPNDEWAEIVLSKTRIRRYLGTETGRICLRIVKIETDSGKEEVLLTNLPDDAFDAS